MHTRLTCLKRFQTHALSDLWFNKMMMKHNKHFKETNSNSYYSIHNAIPRPSSSLSSKLHHPLRRACTTTDDHTHTRIPTTDYVVGQEITSNNLSPGSQIATINVTENSPNVFGGDTYTEPTVGNDESSCNTTESMMSNKEDLYNLTPQEMIKELDRFVIGQKAAKKAVAIAWRARWRRHKMDSKFRRNVTPKNILMIGPTGCGKTEVARRLAKISGSPFVKVEATKYTEVGYVGKDVSSIIEDLVTHAATLVKKEKRKKWKKN